MLLHPLLLISFKIPIYYLKLHQMSCQCFLRLDKNFHSNKIAMLPIFPFVGTFAGFFLLRANYYHLKTNFCVQYLIFI